MNSRDEYDTNKNVEIDVLWKDRDDGLSMNENGFYMTEKKTLSKKDKRYFYTEKKRKFHEFLFLFSEI